MVVLSLVPQVLDSSYVDSTDTARLLHATYYYYAHGPLRRVELGDSTQGIDYIYTLQGQLKAINHPDLDPAKDPGHDGQPSFPYF